MVLTSKAPQFLPLSACRPINALAGVPLGLLHPSGNRLGGRLELARQLFGRASRSTARSGLTGLVSAGGRGGLRGARERYSIAAIVSRAIRARALICFFRASASAE